MDTANASKSHALRSAFRKTREIIGGHAAAWPRVIDNDSRERMPPSRMIATEHAALELSNPRISMTLLIADRQRAGVGGPEGRDSRVWNVQACTLYTSI